MHFEYPRDIHSTVTNSWYISSRRAVDIHLLILLVGTDVISAWEFISFIGDKISKLSRKFHSFLSAMLVVCLLLWRHETATGFLWRQLENASKPKYLTKKFRQIQIWVSKIFQESWKILSKMGLNSFQTASIVSCRDSCKQTTNISGGVFFNW